MRIGIAIVVLSVALAGCDDGFLSGLPTPVPGSGNAATEARDVAGFTRVDVSGSGKLILDLTGSESLSITADDNLLPYLRSEVVDGVLILGTKPNSGISTRVRPEYRVTAKSLDGLTLSGSVEADVGSIDAGQFNVNLSGSAAATVEGNAARQHVTTSGSSTYNAGRLPSQAADIDSSGSSNCVVQVQSELTVKATGASKVEYIGDPTVNTTLEGSASVVHR
jgi:hypothetical protein